MQAQIFARVYGAFPGLTIDLLSVVNRFLPRGEGTASYQGKESEMPVSRSFLTRLGQIASRTYNELSNSRS